MSMSSTDTLPLAPQQAVQTQPLRVAFQNTYVGLPQRFYARVEPMRVAAPRLVKVNDALARQLGLDPAALAGPEGVEVLAGNVVAAGSEPLAQAYAGHQFGNFVPQLGDGRARVLGEVVDPHGARFDLQLKGAGRTPFSRNGDGRAALGPVLREYLLSEAMAALRVPTTRALAAVTTGEPVYRDTVQPGAVFTRVAASHLRVGTFQFFASRGDVEGVQILADYAIARHYPEATQSQRPYRAFLEGVIARQAALVAQWMLLGFIHGVLNTDNTSISGETIDYGPCAFLEAYEPGKVFSSIDHRGRYAYSNQPHAMHWNLARLAETLLPLLAEEEGSEEGAVASATEALATFAPLYDTARFDGLRRKLGLTTVHEGDAALAEDLLERMAAQRADFTLTFRRLCDAAASPELDSQISTLFQDPKAFDTWAVAWHARLQQDQGDAVTRAASMRQVNPAVIPRNHYVQAVIDAAVERQDLQPFEDLLQATSQPWVDREEFARYTVPAREDECVPATFCGT